MTRTATFTGAGGTMKNSSIDRLMRLQEVARLIGVSVRTVYRLISDGDLPQPCKVRGCSCIPESAVVRFSERTKQQSKF